MECRKLLWHNIILCPYSCTVTRASSQNILDNWAVSQQLWDAILTGRVDPRARGQVAVIKCKCKVSIYFLKFSWEFWRIQTTHPPLYNTHTCTCYIIKASKLQKYVFHHYKAWERKKISVFLKKLERQNKN